LHPADRDWGSQLQFRMYNSLIRPPRKQDTLTYLINQSLPLSPTCEKQKSPRSCICVLGISNLPISTIFLLNFWNFSDSVIFFLNFIIGCEKRIMMMYRQQGLQKKYCKAEQYCFGAWGQAETSLKMCR
jgi:hypothetical protein